MSTLTKIERLTQVLKTKNLDATLTSKLPVELKTRLSVKSLTWVVSLMDELQNLNAQLDSITDEMTEKEAQVLIESQS